MKLKIIPYILIIIPILGFLFGNNLDTSKTEYNGIRAIGYFIWTLPWWGKLISIFIGFSWISIQKKN